MQHTLWAGWQEAGGASAAAPTRTALEKPLGAFMLLMTSVYANCLHGYNMCNVMLGGMVFMGPCIAAACWESSALDPRKHGC
jgi:hypothetical protein